MLLNFSYRVTYQASIGRHRGPLILIVEHPALLLLIQKHFFFFKERINNSLPQQYLDALRAVRLVSRIY